MSTVPSPASAAEALGMLTAAMGYLAATDATAMATEEQARCLRVMERATAIGTAAHASVLGAFSAGQGYTDDGDGSPRAWLVHHTGITQGAATGHVAWVRRAAAHPLIAQALAEGELSESAARALCQWTGKLPEECRDAADEILATAARAGMDLEGLAALAAEIHERARPQAPDEDTDFDDRSVRLETTFEGAGVLHGNLTPECAALAGSVLDALSAPAGPEDTRTEAQRCHDALEEALRRLAASGMLPERAGQPFRAWVHVSLADLMMLDGDSALQEQWTAQVRADWAAHRAVGSVAGSDGGAWLDGAAAGAVTCDASVAPFVTGTVNLGALDELVRLSVQLDKLHRDGSESVPEAETALSQEALERAIIGKAVELVSGPGGLASFLRRRQLGARLAGPSLPLDIGYADTIPAGIRNAVILRDQHCRFPGCTQPAKACHVHHVKHKADGGATSVAGCLLLCPFHHLVVVHRWGWKLVLNSDGTTTAWNPDRTKVLYSHGPPAKAG